MSLIVKIDLDLTKSAIIQLVRAQSNVGIVSLKENGRPLIDIDINRFIPRLIKLETESNLRSYSKRLDEQINTDNIDFFNNLSAEYSTSTKIAEFALTIGHTFPFKEEYRPRDPLSVPGYVVLRMDYQENNWNLSMSLLNHEVSTATHVGE